MTHRERILAVCRGEKADRIPWIPRLDLWHNAHASAGTLPAPYRGASLREITDDMGVGYHAVIPNFVDVRTPDDTVDRCLGVYRLRGMCFETRLREVEREVSFEGDATRVTYHTPVGSVSCRFSYTAAMKEAGASISWCDEHPWKGPDDYRALEHIFSHLEVVRTHNEYAKWQAWVGEDGAAVAFGSLSASPVHHIMRELMPMTDFFLEMHDHPDRVLALARTMERWFEETFAALVESSAEILLMGANYDETITYPPFFEQHFLPWLSHLAEMAHARGKLVLTHTDGENRGLTDLYRRCHFDVADSVCPKPMTKLSLEETMDRLPGITIWGGIPSVALLPESVSDVDFEHLVDEAIALAKARGRLILGVADTTPANASLDRLKWITERVSG